MFIGSMNFFAKFIDKLELNMKLWYNLLQDNDELRWNNELETMFQQIRTSFTKVVTLTLPKTNSPFFVTVDSTLIGKGCVPLKMIYQTKVDNYSYNIRFLITREQKLFTTYRQLVGILWSLTIYEQTFIGTDRLINVLNGHEPILSCFVNEENFFPLF